MITIKFGPVTTSEINVMLEASADSGSALAQSILAAVTPKGAFVLTIEQAEYLREELSGDAERVAMAVGPAAGNAFHRAGEKLLRITLREKTLDRAALRLLKRF